MPGGADGRRLEVAVDSLPVSGGSQLAVDTTMVRALHEDGTPRRHAAERRGRTSACQAEESRLIPGPRQAVVLAVEVGGPWSGETRGFLSQQARARAREETPLMRRRAEQA